jgi:phosphonate transport system substrate-binding protein
MNFSVRRRDLIAILSSALPLSGRANTGQRLVMGIVPQILPSVIFEKWKPLVNEISKLAKIDIDIKLYPSIPQFETAFLQGEFDLVYLNPYHAVMAHKAQGYLPMVRDIDQLEGILVIRDDSAINSLMELDKSKMTFPSPNAFGASLYMRALLTEKYKLKFQTTYSQTHSNVYRQVINGTAQAGGGIQSTLHQQPENIKKQLRIIFKTPKAPSHPIAVHPRVTAAQRTAMEKALLGLNANSEGLKLLRAIGMNSLIRTDFSEYKPLENLRLEQYVMGVA